MDNLESLTFSREGNTSSSSAVSPLIAHLIYRLDVGGLENGLVNLLNNDAMHRYRHVIICLTDATTFRKRIQRANVEIIELRKKPGQDWKLYGTLWRLFRRLRPAIIHSRNLASLEAQVPALLAGVRRRVHSEHGIEMTSWRYTLLRKALRGFVQVYIPLSKELQKWLIREIGVPEKRIVQIYNGVNTDTFHLRAGAERPALPKYFAPPDCLVIGTVGRLAPIKDQGTLINAFATLLKLRPHARQRLRLVIAGDGELKNSLLEMLRDNNIVDITWMPGSRDDVPDLLRSIDVFVLSSTNEGVSNTILEAMASSLPVVATAVGGNPELVLDGITGRLVPRQDPNALALALAEYLDSPPRIQQHGNAGRQRCMELFSLDQMVENYLSVYDSLLKQGSLPAKLMDDKRTPHVIMAGPLPPAVGGMATLISSLANSSLAKNTRLELFNTGKTTPPNRPWYSGVAARSKLLCQWWQRLSGSHEMIAHIHSCSGLSFFLDGMLLLIARWRGHPVLLHMHGGFFDKFLDNLPSPQRAAAQYIARSANRFGCGSFQPRFFGYHAANLRHSLCGAQT